MIVGHEQVLAGLPRPAPVMLFLGPRGVGKKTVAHHLRKVWGFSGFEVNEFFSLDMEGARALVDLVGYEGQRRLVIIRLNHTTAAVQTVLLKAIEESKNTFFLLLSEKVPMDTILSRSQLWMFRPLTTEQVATLLEQHGYKPKKALALATLSAGTVRSARDAERMLEVKPAVLGAVRAIAEQDPVALDKLANTWTEEHTLMLRRWVHEVLSRNFGVYAEYEALLPRPTALKILIALSSNVRPKLQVRAGLMGLVVAA